MLLAKTCLLFQLDASYQQNIKISNLRQEDKIFFFFTLLNARAKRIFVNKNSPTTFDLNYQRHWLFQYYLQDIKAPICIYLRADQDICKSCDLASPKTQPFPTSASNLSYSQNHPREYIFFTDSLLEERDSNQIYSIIKCKEIKSQTTRRTYVFAFLIIFVHMNIRSAISV